jgi:hypothetical protein
LCVDTGVPPEDAQRARDQPVRRNGGQHRHLQLAGLVVH